LIKQGALSWRFCVSTEICGARHWKFGPACRRHCTSGHARPYISIDPLPSVNGPSPVEAFVRLSSVTALLLFTIAIETTTIKTTTIEKSE
jgi:hypothetical protein